MEQIEETVAEKQQTEYTFEQLERALLQAHSGDSPERATAAIPQAQEAEPSQPQPDAGTEASGTDQEPAETQQSLTVKDLAEKLGMDPAEVYKSVQIEGLSLSQIKDRLKDLNQVEALQAKVQDDRLRVENELLQKRRAIQVAESRMGRQPTPQELQQAKQEWAVYQDVQATLAAELIPDWADPVEREKGQKAVEVLAAEYMFSAAEIPTLVDARLRKVFYDLHRLRSEIKQVAAKEVRDRRNQAPKAYTKTSDIVTDTKSKLASGKLTQDQAVAQLGRLLG